MSDSDHRKHCLSHVMMTGTLTIFALLFTVWLATASVLGFVELERDETSDNGQNAVISSDGRHVYAVSLTEYRLMAYSRDPDSGALELVQSLVNLENGLDGIRAPVGVAISPDGGQVYVIGLFEEPFDVAISWFLRDANTGALTYAGSLMQDVHIPSGFGNPTGKVSFSPDGFFLYAGDVSRGVTVFQRADNGTLTFVETVLSDVDSLSLDSFLHPHVNPDGKNLYTTSGDGFLYVFARDAITGKLTPIQTFNDVSKNLTTGTSVTGLDTAEDIVVTADGNYAYVVAKIENDVGTVGDDHYCVTVFSRDAVDGRLTFIGNVTNEAPRRNSLTDTLWWPTGVTLSTDAEQKFLYVSSQIADSVNVFRRHSVDGSLTWLGWEVTDDNGVTSLNSAQSVTLSPDGRHLYVQLGNGPGGIAVFDTRADLEVVKIDSADPVLTSAALSYTLTVTNNGPSDAQNVTLTDLLPQGVSFISASVNAPGTSCTDTNGTITCQFGAIPELGSVTATLEATTPVSAGTISNTADIEADQLDTATMNNSDTEETVVADPEN